MAFRGEDRHVRINLETGGWAVASLEGASDGIGLGVHLRGDGFKADVDHPVYIPETNVGGYGVQVAEDYLKNVRVTLNVIPTPSTANELLTMILTRGTNGQPNSYTVQECVEGAVHERYVTGVIVNTATIGLNFESGDFTISAECMGKEVTAGDGIGGFTTSPLYIAENVIMAKGGTIGLPNGSSQSNVYSAEIRVENQAEAGPPDNAGLIQAISCGRMRATGSIVCSIEDDTLYALAVAGGTTSFGMMGMGGTTGVIITCPIIKIHALRRDVPLSRRARQTLEFTCLGTGGTGSAGVPINFSV